MKTYYVLVENVKCYRKGDSWLQEQGWYNTSVVFEFEASSEREATSMMFHFWLYFSHKMDYIFDFNDNWSFVDYHETTVPLAISTSFIRDQPEYLYPTRKQLSAMWHILKGMHCNEYFKVCKQLSNGLLTPEFKEVLSKGIEKHKVDVATRGTIPTRERFSKQSKHKSYYPTTEFSEDYYIDFNMLY